MFISCGPIIKLKFCLRLRGFEEYLVCCEKTIFVNRFLSIVYYDLDISNKNLK